MEPDDRMKGDLYITNMHNDTIQMHCLGNGGIGICIKTPMGVARFTATNGIGQELACWLDKHTGRNQSGTDYKKAYSRAMDRIQKLDSTAQQLKDEVRRLKAYNLALGGQVKLLEQDLGAAATDAELLRAELEEKEERKLNW